MVSIVVSAASLLVHLVKFSREFMVRNGLLGLNYTIIQEVKYKQSIKDIRNMNPYFFLHL